MDTPLFYMNNIFSFFEIHTFARVYYFMTKTKYIYNWMSFMYTLYTATIVPSLSPVSMPGKARVRLSLGQCILLYYYICTILYAIVL